MAIKKVKLGNGQTKWEVRIHENGRGSRRVTRRFDRRNDAEAFVQSFRQELIEKARDPYSGISLRDRMFADEAEYWKGNGKLRFSESHLKRVNGVLAEILPEFGHLTVDRLTPELIMRFQEKEKAKGLANSTINRKTEVISAILNFSTKHRRIPYNPTNGFSKLKQLQSEMSFWNEDEAISFLSEMDELHPRGSKDRWIYVVYLVALNTAMRAGEIWGLQLKDLTPDALWVRRQFNRVTLTFTPTKGKKARHVPCPAVLKEEIDQLVKGLKPDDTIFRNAQGNPICHDNFADRTFIKDIKAWGGRRIRFHDLRHTAATLMISKNIDLKTVKEICGHADITTTMNYAHLLAGSITKVARSFSLSSNLQEKEVGQERKLSVVR